MIKSSYYKILFGLVVILALFFIAYPFVLSGGELTSPDTPGLWCGAKTLLTTGEFNSGESNDAGYHSCWKSTTYPSYQLFIAGLSFPFNENHIDKVIIFSSVLGTFLCILFIYLIVNKIWQDKWINLLSIFFTSSALPLQTANMLTPHNLWGFWGILLVVNEFLKYFKTKKKINLFLIVLYSGLTYFFHQLSFFVLLIVLFLFVLIALKNWKIKILSLLAVFSGAMILSIFYFKTYNIFSLLFNFDSGEEIGIHNFLDHPLVLGYFLTLFGLVGLVLFWRGKAQKNIKILFLSLFIGPLIFTITPYFGLEVVPFRFLYFLWIPLALLAGYGWLYFVKFIKHCLPRTSFILLLLVLFFASSANFIIFGLSNYEKYSQPYLMSEVEKNTYSWLQDNINKDDKVLALYYNYHHPAVLLPSYLDAQIKIYAPTLKNYIIYENIFTDPNSEQSKRYKNIENSNFNGMDWVVLWPENLSDNLISGIEDNAELKLDKEIIKVYKISQ